MIEIIQIILGTLFALFIPGFLAVRLFFPEFRILERIAFSIAFSIMISIAIGIFLGYSEEWAQVTGGLTLKGIIISEAAICLSLLAGLLARFLYNKKRGR